jgi:hypothetical protein
MDPLQTPHGLFLIPALFRLQVKDQVSSLNRARSHTEYRLILFFGLDPDPRRIYIYIAEWTPIQGFLITARFRSFLFVFSFHGGFIINTLLNKNDNEIQLFHLFYAY